ncbi:urea transporter [Leucosporidium creatinivorum]|uniref:Urea transporter n=1 Tax=Leucosporidium creatinivorum TaxID=106004 RepID=A0A1Y2G2C5_9BASI|nr:urea transporter [Leucosporidium creatinivorum]
MLAGLMWLQNRYSDIKSDNTAEFSSASSSVKPGLIAAGICSAWTWAATLLQSSAVAFRYGLSGSYWYSGGATVQVLLFSMNASALKQRAPGARTYLEVIRCRWGTLGHLTFLFFGLCTNLLVSAMLITGGSSSVSALTGMPIPAACCLIPVGVVIYVFIGGMRASLYADYVHTAVLYSIIISFMFVVYATSDQIGSPSRMWELLQEASARDPVPGNAGGSYLTMRSTSGLIFGIVNLCGNFSTVFLDQAYWQRAIASQPVTCVQGFLLGGSAWLAIPLAFASTLGLAARALQYSPTWPGYPNVLTENEIGSGLPAPAAAAALLGKVGGSVILVLIFLAVVSSAAAELVAVSNILTFDVYCVYINPKATDKQTLRFDHIMIAAYGLFMGVLGIIFWSIGISMGWLYLFMGVLLGGGVFPVALCVLSANANRLGCIAGAWSGLAMGVIAWLVTASSLNGGEISVATTSGDYPMLAGNLASIGTSAIISLSTTFLFPARFDFDITRAIGQAVEESEVKGSPSSTEGALEGEDDKEKAVGANSTNLKSATASINATEEPYDENKDPVKLRASFRLAMFSSIAASLVLIILVPLPLFGSSHIFPRGGFTAWIVVCFIWIAYGIVAVVLFPIFEYRASLLHLFQGIVDDISGKRRVGEVKKIDLAR